MKTILLLFVLLFAAAQDDCNTIQDSESSKQQKIEAAAPDVAPTPYPTPEPVPEPALLDEGRMATNSPCQPHSGGHRFTDPHRHKALRAALGFSAEADDREIAAEREAYRQCVNGKMPQRPGYTEVSGQ